MQKKILFVLTITLLFPLSAFTKQSAKAGKSEKLVIKAAVLWRPPQNIEKQDLFYGAGGKVGQPIAPFRFIEEESDGSNPKFVVKDAHGIRWKVKLGSEAQPETAATRLLWAVGYFTDVDYYLPRVRIEGLPSLKRGQNYVMPGGIISGARFERSTKKVDNWSWFDNPFVGRKELDGLRVMMALLNNWDLKQENNAIYNVNGRELHYVVGDLGSTFGKTGGGWTRSKGNLEDYLESKFIDDVKPATIDMVSHNRPPFLYAVAVPYYVNRVRMEKIAEDIPRPHARWVGQILARLSVSQIKDAFRAANYSLSEVDAYAEKVQERIRQLNRL